MIVAERARRILEHLALARVFFAPDVPRKRATVRFMRRINNRTNGFRKTMFQAHGWARARRVVLIRQRTKERDFVRDQELFDDPAYVYQAILTDRREPPEEAWPFYRGRAEIENQIRG